MKAVGYHRSKPIAEPESLLDFELPDPTPGARDLLVRVEAVSVNPVDTKMRMRTQPEEGAPPQVLGWDAAGTVEAVGPEVTLFSPGDQVFYAGAIDRPGSNSELHLVDERIVGRKPASLDMAEAAALPLTAITAWELLFDRLGVPYGVKTGGGSLLVVGGAGGVGSILIQIASRLTGLTVIATASRPETEEWVRRMGAHQVIDHRRPLDEALAEAGLGPVDYVASLTATGQHLAAYAKLIAPQGGLAVIDDPQSLDILPFKRKCIRICWEFMFARPLFGTLDMIEQHRLLNEVSALVDSGVLRSTLNERAGPIDAATLRRVHALVESGKAIGKSVLSGF